MRKANIFYPKYGALYLSLLLTVFILGGCSVKPQPYSEGQFLTLALTDQKAMMEGVPELNPDGKLGLEEAIIRALAFNLDHRLALSENLAAERDRVLAAVSMLPDLTLTGNFYDRSNTNASSSISYRSGQQSLEPSYSNDRGRQWGGLEFSWSILDCGLSYYQAKQQADRVLITLERRRRTMNTIIKDVITTYYRALAAQRYLGQVRTVLGEAEQALAMYRRIEKEQAQPLAEVLESQRRLVNIISQFKRIESDLRQSQVQLAALCNYPVRSKVKLVSQPFKLPTMKQDIADLELLALYRRPELREEHYQERVDIAAVKQEIVKMFPGIRLLAGWNWDSNPYLVHSDWVEAGIQASASLLKLIGTGPSGKKAAEAKQQMSQMRRLALSMATLVQVNLSRHQYQVALEELKTSGSLRTIEKRLLEQLRTEAEQEANGRLAVVQQKAQSLNSELLYDLARVDAFNALGNLYFSVGVGLGDGLPPDATIDEISLAVQNGLNMLAKGELPPLPATEHVDDVPAPTVFNDGLSQEERRTAINVNVRSLNQP